MRAPALTMTLTAALVFTSAAGAVPPTLSAVGSQDRHPTATFAAPKSDHVVIEVASKPDRASSGEFLSENIKVFDVMADSEIQSGRWLYASQLDPGSYYVVIRASPSFDLCYLGGGTYDPSCADGYSDVMPLTISTPTIKYTAVVTRVSYLSSVELRLVANPLGQKVPYRVCYLTIAKKRQCLSGTLAGYSWSDSADDRLTVKTRSLARLTTFTWSVGGKTVVVKRARVR